MTKNKITEGTSFLITDEVGIAKRYTVLKIVGFHAKARMERGIFRNGRFRKMDQVTSVYQLDKLQAKADQVL